MKEENSLFLEKTVVHSTTLGLLEIIRMEVKTANLMTSIGVLRTVKDKYLHDFQK